MSGLELENWGPLPRRRSFRSWMALVDSRPEHREAMLNIGQDGYEANEMANEIEFRASMQRLSWAHDRQTPASNHREDSEETDVPSESLCSPNFSLVGRSGGPEKPEGPVTVEPAARVEPPEELSNYWPDITKAIKECHRGNIPLNPRPELLIGKVTCRICNDKELEIDATQIRLPWQERSLLTACGHVLGRECLETWDITCSELGAQTKFTCPSCRFDLDPPQCSAHRLTAVTDLGWAFARLRTWASVDGIRPSGHSNNEDAANCSRCQE